MKQINYFIIVWVIIGISLFVISLHYRKQSDAIVAQVEPQKTAISFQKPVKIKAIYVIPGQEVEEGELLMELERPDLLYDIEQVNNELNAVMQERKLLIDQINSQMRMATLENQNKVKSLEAEILQLETKIKLNKDLVSSLEKTGQSAQKNEESSIQSIPYLQLEALRKERKQLHSIYQQRIAQLKERKTNELSIFDLKIEMLRKEIDLLHQEINYLKSYAPLNGTIGDVMAQLGELIPPYETIISIYEKYPRIIKAYMNEKNRYNLNVGDAVLVESSNRTYHINGKVAEIGSRIVTYPGRLLVDQQIKIWGQEIFIEIPEENQFLNGEKVYVRQQ